LAVTLATPGQVHADAAIHHPGLPTQIGAAKSTDFMHARYYSPNLGRFLSVDQVGGTIGSSQSWNRYSYAKNSPTNRIDPDGNADTAWGYQYTDYAWRSQDAIVAGTKTEADYSAENLTFFAVGVSATVVAAELITHLPLHELLPDTAWNKNAPKQVEPGTETIEHTKFNPDTKQVETSRVDYDEYGRQTQRTDYTDHGRGNDPVNPHEDPHHHTTTYGPGTGAGQEHGQEPGPAPGHSDDPPEIEGE
jgi:RHS repeat-associated protein